MDNLTWTVIGALSWTALGWFLSYMGLDHQAVVILTIALILDFLLGIADAYFEDRESVTSENARRWLAKKITRWILPLVVSWCLMWAGVDGVNPLVAAVLWIIILTEWYSIIGHIYSINTGRKLPEIDALELLMEQISQLFLDKSTKKDIKE